MIEWTGKPDLAPFSWNEPLDVLVSTDVFKSDRYDLEVDGIFAVMALCPQHQFRLVTDFPERFRAYVQKITTDRMEWMTWRVEASFVLRRIGRAHEAKGHGPVWPLANVKLADFSSSHQTAIRPV